MMIGSRDSSGDDEVGPARVGEVNPIVDIPSDRGNSESHKTTPTLV